MNTILSMVGISAVVSIFVAFIFEVIKNKINLRFEKLFMEKMERYRSILVNMSVLINKDNYLHIQATYKPANSSSDSEIKKYYLDELKLHKSFCILFADEGVITCLTNFIEEPTQEGFDETAKAMRYDLWHNKYRK